MLYSETLPKHRTLEMCWHGEKILCLCVELDIRRPEEHIAQSKAQDNSNHLNISLVKANRR